MDRWQQLQDDIGVFSDRTFGKSSAYAKAMHLKQEVQEAADDPADVIEWADCMILLLDAARVSGFSTEDIYEAARRKMKINETRKWGKPDADGVVRHVKDGEAA